jgi:hypothetical protein
LWIVLSKPSSLLGSHSTSPETRLASLLMHRGHMAVGACGKVFSVDMITANSSSFELMIFKADENYNSVGKWGKVLSLF